MSGEVRRPDELEAIYLKRQGSCTRRRDLELGEKGVGCKAARRRILPSA